MIKAIIFDLDGTLVQTEKLKALCYAIAAQLLGPAPVIDNKAASSRIPWLLTTTVSLANVPASSVPCGFTATGPPIG